MRRICIILNFSRSGGTLLTRIMGKLPDVIIASEINSTAGVNPENRVVTPEIALQMQMQKWYGINLIANSFSKMVSDLVDICSSSAKQLFIRDWTRLDFRSCKENEYSPKYRFSLIDEISQNVHLVKIGFVRDAIDVYLSSGGNLFQFADDYLRYVNQLVSDNIPIFKYEDLIAHTENTVKAICSMTGTKFSYDFLDYEENHNCTGDIQLGRASRGIRHGGLAKLPRKWIPRDRRKEIDRCSEITQANHLLDYPIYYDSIASETPVQMIWRRTRDRYEIIRQKIKANEK